MMGLIALSLCIYFAYHIIYGERSITKLAHLSGQIETMSKINDNISLKKQNLESRVAMMRPGSINKDLLEERARVVLGYKSDNEMIVIQHPL